jgi:hypothetical protein
MERVLPCVGLLLGAATLAGCGGGGKPSGSQKPPPPVFAKTVNLSPVSGKVSIKVPPASSFSALSSERQVPVGTTVDASAGVVRLAAATGGGTPLDAGDFQAGIFEIRQSRAEPGVTELRIRDGQPASKACGTQRGRTQRVFGRLLGNAHGRFRTRGEFSVATVRGTDWGVRDRCDGTLTVVRRGVVAVTDVRRHTTIVVHAGHSVLVRAP